MNEREAFIRGIAANLYDDAPRLAFADWLDEHGEHDRAEFIRVQIELEPIRDRYENPRAAELHRREAQGAKAVELNDPPLGWLGPRPERWGKWPNRISIEYARGFPDLAQMNPRMFVEDGRILRDRLPTLRRLVLHSFIGWGAQVAASPALRGLPELELACWYDDADITALARSPHLSELQVLVLWTGRQREFFEDPDLCRIAAGGAAWPNLRELRLVDPESENEAGVRQLVELVNRTAGRDIGRYERGYPDLFPLAAHFYHEFPVCGHLPDGRTAIAFLDRGPGYTLPPNAPYIGFLILTFDATGEQTDDVIRVPFPSEPGNVARDEEHVRRLVAVTGFVPGFIRVKGYHLTGYNLYGPCRGRYDSWNSRGYPDVPGGDGGDHEYGCGGEIYGLVRNGEFEVGSSGWADKSGEVHST